tara:strand:+ start:66 stop:284 length:219 start_codon:yes stop_codon:yes gene_type:complete
MREGGDGRHVTLDGGLGKSKSLFFSPLSYGAEPMEEFVQSGGERWDGIDGMGLDGIVSLGSDYEKTDLSFCL